MALREVAIPQHISILYVQQEVVGDDTPAIESVLQADVHRTRLMAEEAELNALLQKSEDSEAQETTDGTEVDEDVKAKRLRKRDEATARLGEVQQLLVDIEAETGPSRAGELLAGLGFSTSDQAMPTRAFSGGWRMRLSLARALFCKPDLLLLDEPSNNLDLNALAWLEDYLQTWPSTLFVVSHDRAFLDAVATDIIHQHGERLDYYKGEGGVIGLCAASTDSATGRLQATSPNSMLPSRNAPSSRSANTSRSCNIASICRPSSTGGVVSLDLLFAVRTQR